MTSTGLIQALEAEIASANLQYDVVKSIWEDDGDEEALDDMIGLSGKIEGLERALELAREAL